eukprot:5336298-Amphidinium_carterae.1
MSIMLIGLQFKSCDSSPDHPSDMLCTHISSCIGSTRMGELEPELDTLLSAYLSQSCCLILVGGYTESIGYWHLRAGL